MTFICRFQTQIMKKETEQKPNESFPKSELEKNVVGFLVCQEISIYHLSALDKVKAQTLFL